ncbi:MAG: GNAT family N-acetyltransferase [Mobilicoccus sp.]|nr:GNAT family N-acetyltransferase [Mobilicoccus sp.]
MPRVHPSVVPMSDADVDDVAVLWIARRVEMGYAADSARRAVEESRFREAVLRDYVTVLLAVVDGQVVGYVWLTSHPMTAQLDVPSLGIEDTYVVPEFRDMGVGKTLLTAAATSAHKRGIEHVSSAVPTSAKDTHRALARLGFAATVTRRVAQTHALMRRLRGPESRAGGVDQLLLQRRRRAQRQRDDIALAAT